MRIGNMKNDTLSVLHSSKRSMAIDDQLDTVTPNTSKQRRETSHRQGLSVRGHSVVTSVHGRENGRSNGIGCASNNASPTFEEQQMSEGSGFMIKGPEGLKLVLYCAKK